MSEMIDRVAKAICVESGHPWEHAGQGYRETCTDFARAAIEAMREPDDAMRLASKRYKRGAKVYSGPECYRQMVAAALSPAGEK